MPISPSAYGAGSPTSLAAIIANNSGGKQKSWLDSVPGHGILDNAIGVIPAPIRTVARGAMDLADTPRAAIFSTVKELRDVNNGKGFSMGDLVKQTRNNISATEALDLQRFGTLGVLGGLALDVGVGAATMPGAGLARTGRLGEEAATAGRLSRFAKVLKPSSAIVARDLAEGALANVDLQALGAAQRAGTVETALRTSMTPVMSAREAVLANPLLDAAARVIVKGKGAATADELARIGFQRTLTIGHRAIPGTERAAEMLDSAVSSLGLREKLIRTVTREGGQAADEAAIVLGNKIDNAILEGKDINAIKDAAKREGGTATRVSQLLDSFGQTNTRTRRAAITAVDTGDTAPLLDELMKTTVKREVAAQTISTIKQHRANTGDDITAALGGKDVREALAPLRALDDRGLAALKNAVEGGPSLGDDVSDAVEAILTKTTRRIYSYNQEFWDNNPRLYDAMGKDLQRRIVNFENTVGAPLQGAAGGTLQKAKLASMGVQDVVSGVIAPWAETQIKVLGLAGALGNNARETAVSLARTTETMGRLSLISGFENLAPMEDTISKAYAASQEFRGALDMMAVKKSLLSTELQDWKSFAAGKVKETYDQAVGAREWDLANSTVQRMRDMYPEVTDLLDPVHVKYLDMAENMAIVEKGWEEAKKVSDSFRRTGLQPFQEGGTQTVSKVLDKYREAALSKEAEALKLVKPAADQYKQAVADLSKTEEILTSMSQDLRGLVDPSLERQRITGMQQLTQQARNADVAALRMEMRVDHLLNGVLKKQAGSARTLASDVSGLSERQLQTILNSAGDADAAFTNAAIAKMHDNMIRLDKYGAIDEAAFRRMTATFPGSDAIAPFTKYTQGITNLFRTMAISSPGFSNRNFFGGMMNNFAYGVTLEDTRWAVRQAGLLKAGKEADPDFLNFASTIQDEALSRGVEIDQFAGKIKQAAQNVQSRLDRTPVSVRGLLTRTTEQVETETALRGALFRRARLGGLSVEAALDLVAKVHFDYTDLSHLDIAAKRLIPFWTWTTRNLPAQAELLVRGMGSGNRIEMAMLNAKRREEGSSNLPPWLAGTAFALPNNRALTLGGLPSADLFSLLDAPSGRDVVQSFAGQVSPALLTPIEQVFGRRVDSGMPVKGSDTIRSFVPPIGLAGRLFPKTFPSLASKSQEDGIQGRLGVLLPFDIRNYNKS